ncbi:MAG: NAD-dependent DNA ligase LigA [Planctomycetota bacterium]|jgi:DNA ligase (NAD+)
MNNNDSFTALDAKRLADELKEEINKHNHAYYVLAKPTVSDAEFDVLFNELKELERRWPQIADENSPTQKVGSQVLSSFPKAKHAQKMLSLDNAFESGDVTTFFSGHRLITGIVEPKIDGLSLSLRYKDGKLVKAITRGDGATGDDVTANAKVIKSIPLVLEHPFTVEVRGEVCMFFSVFDSLNEQLKTAGEDQFANPRNAAAGSMKQKDSRVVAKRGLSFVAYGSAVPAKFLDDAAGFAKREVEHTHDNVLKWLTKEGFMTVYNYPSNIQDVLRSHFCADMAEKEYVSMAVAWGEDMRKLAPFPTDGLVFKVNDLALHAELGEGTRFPKWAVAYKFPPERKPTKLLGVEVSVGRHGTITPVALLEPLQLSGTTVQRASICNQDEVERLGINVGDMVYVEKSAEIIPKIMGIATKNVEGFWKMPSKCPSCGTALTREEGKVAYRCTYHGCPAQVTERLEHALGKSALDWDGMGTVQVKNLVEIGISNLSDLLAIPDDDINSALTTAAAKKFLHERERVKKAPLWRKIHALGIEGIGRSLSQDLCARWNSLDAMVEHIDEVKTVLGDVVWSAFKDGLLMLADEIDRLQSFGYLFEEESGSIGRLSGKVFCITGTMKSGTREEVAAKIEAAGGMVKSSVSKKVNFLINGPGAGASKANKAKKHGTAIISEEQLYEMMGVPMTVVERRDYENE